MIKSTCKKCKESFFYDENSNKIGAYCSLKCFHEFTYVSENKNTCLVCSKDFIFKTYKRSSRDFCGLECYYKNRKRLSQDNESIKQRLLKYTERDKNGCLIWKKNVNNSGYGSMSFKNKKMSIHRIIWTITHGKIPDKMVVAHRCDIRRCVAIDHLFLATTKENVHDCIKKGRKTDGSHFGLLHAIKKYDAKQIIQVKDLATKGLSLLDIEKKTGVKKASVRYILKDTI